MTSPGALAYNRSTSAARRARTTLIYLGSLDSAESKHVAPDGRFLINITTEETSTSPITLLLNWKPPAK